MSTKVQMPIVHQRDYELSAANLALARFMQSWVLEYRLRPSEIVRLLSGVVTKYATRMSRNVR